MSYERLEVYRAAYQMAIEIHRLTREFPKHEIYEMGSQLRRAAVSIALNIAEGYGRKEHQQELKNFLLIARGSCNETKVLLQMVRDLGYVEESREAELEEKYDQIGKQLTSFIKAIKSPKSNV